MESWSDSGGEGWDARRSDSGGGVVGAELGASRLLQVGSGVRRGIWRRGATVEEGVGERWRGLKCSGNEMSPAVF